MKCVKVMAIDYGKRFVGLAVTDDEGRIPLRHSTIDQKQEDSLARVAEFVHAENVSHVVVGVPVSLAGGESEQARSCRRFLEELRLCLPADVVLAAVDERLTSKEAAQRLQADGSRPEEEHAEAARLMLEAWLNHTKKS